MIAEGISSIVHSDFYIKTGNGTSIQRNVFENVDYDEYEQKLINQMKARIKERQLTLKFKKSILLKMLMAALYDIDRGIENCQAHLKFLEDYPKLNYSEELKKGPIYVCGFDNQYRPVIVIRESIDIKIIAYFLETVKRQLLIDYYVENWTIILDLDTELPILELDDLLYLQLHFYGNLNKILILNGPDDIDDIVKQFTEKIKDLSFKVKIITEYQQILQYIPKEQLEIKYGGDLNNIELFWPLLKRDVYNTATSKLLKKQSHLSVNSLSSSVNKKPSFMKITVQEENGNVTLAKQVEVLEEDQVDSDQSLKQQQQQQQQNLQQQEDFEEKSKSYQSSTTKKAQVDQQFIQIDDDDNDLIDMDSADIKRPNQKHSTKKYGEATKTTTYSQKQTILEDGKEVPSSMASCCSRSCSIF